MPKLPDDNFSVDDILAEYETKKRNKADDFDINELISDAPSAEKPAAKQNVKALARELAKIETEAEAQAESETAPVKPIKKTRPAEEKLSHARSADLRSAATVKPITEKPRRFENAGGEDFEDMMSKPLVSRGENAPAADDAAERSIAIEEAKRLRADRLRAIALDDTIGEIRPLSNEDKEKHSRSVKQEQDSREAQTFTNKYRSTDDIGQESEPYVPKKKTVPIDPDPLRKHTAKPQAAPERIPYSTANISSTPEPDDNIVTPPPPDTACETFSEKVGYAVKVTGWFFRELFGIKPKDESKKTSESKKTEKAEPETKKQEEQLLKGFTGMFDTKEITRQSKENKTVSGNTAEYPKRRPSEPVKTAAPLAPSHTGTQADVKPLYPVKPISKEAGSEETPPFPEQKKSPQAEHEKSKLRGFTDIFEKPKGTPAELSGNEITGTFKKQSSSKSKVQPVERKNIRDVDLNLDKLIIPDTTQVRMDAKALEAQKQKELEERRQKKIKDFVLVGDEDETEDEEENNAAEENDDVISDFEKFEDAPSILNDIIQLKTTLIIRSAVLIAALVAALYIAVVNDFSFTPPEFINKLTQPTTYLFVNAILGLLAGFMCFSVVSTGLSKLIALKPDGDTLAVLPLATSLMNILLMLIAASMPASPQANLIRSGDIQIYMTVSIAALLCNTIGKLLIVCRTQNNFEFISGDYERYAMTVMQDEDKASQFTRGTLSSFPCLSSMRRTEFVSGFLKYSYANDITDGFCKYATPVILVFGLIVGVLDAVAGGDFLGGSPFFVGVGAFGSVVAACSCFAVMTVVNLPLFSASAAYSRSKGVIAGYPAIEEFSDVNSVLLDAAQLFPQGMVNLAGIKVYSETRIDEAILEAASLASHSGSVMKTMFYDVIGGKTEMLSPVESYIYEDSMGLCGWINNKRVLLGSRELMLNHSIGGLPTPDKEKEYMKDGRSLVYLSISGELSALFIIELRTSVEVENALYRCEQSGIYLMIRSVDAIISVNRISEMFDISPEIIKLIPFRLHESYEAETCYTQRVPSPVVCNGRFASFASLLIAAKRLRVTIGIGIAILATSILLGVLLALVLTISKSLKDMTPTLLLGINAAFLAVSVLVQSLRRNI